MVKKISGYPTGHIDNLRYCINTITTGLKLARKEKIDIIHSQTFAPALAGSIISSFTSIPHIPVIHDIYQLCMEDYWKKWGSQKNVSTFNSFVGPFFEKSLLKLRHACIHTVSEASKEDLLRLGAKKKIYPIHNSIEIKEVKKSKVNPFQFVFVGRIVFYKNLEVVIKAISKIINDVPEIKFIIIGDGPHREKLEDLVKKLDLDPNVIFKGHSSEVEKNSIISSSNALLFPSLCEGFGLVILESFAHMRPVFTSKIRPMSDIVVHNFSGYVIDPYDENAWAKLILESIHNPQKTNEMGKNGKISLDSKYSKETMYHKIIKMYSDVQKKMKT